MDRTASAGGPTSPHWLPYVLAGVGLLGGLVVVLFEPLPGTTANLLVGGSLLAVGGGSVVHLIARGGGPGGRGPDF